ncbi:GAF domain-containing protein [Neorhizobium sp. P12A]|uniref:trifunctional serine/threonine-protein kinase/ATP-binding protein/sensor histidine kinase n=1 Tax=Neorhizobium sp. P12A TaxID=2268027 RepID=UPI0011F05C07|nr:AAA family ATPase [Neorhizobium sp. P12A]KAA0695564.1 GAF domain-containing protein [Neorhizobium sp. P12A]
MDMSRYRAERLYENASTILYRGVKDGSGSEPILIVDAFGRTARDGLHRLECELAMAHLLDVEWAAKPISMDRSEGKAILLLHDPGGTPLASFLGEPLNIERFLTIAANAAAALKKAHGRGLVHRDIKPASLLIGANDDVWLWGFGRSAKAQHDAIGSVEALPIDLDSQPYSAPECSGRINRPVDARSDLYALGVVFYEMLTGGMPFLASGETEWVHSHLARLPIPMAQWHDEIPSAIEAIVTRLLAKNPDDRYQSAAGLEADLKRCQGILTREGSLGGSEISAGDAPDRLRLPNSLYGRSSQIATLTAAIERVRSSGLKEILLISGPAGVGKSSLVHKMRLGAGGSGVMFAFGKFDQYTRDIPYATIAEAFRGLVRQILSTDDDTLNRWRTELLEALGRNGQIMINLIPELLLVVGVQPPSPELQPHEVKDRFNVVFRRLLTVFARPRRPLALFIDDVQWLDAATIELVEGIIRDPDVSDLLIIFAYRDNEVLPGHPFDLCREAMLKGGTRVAEIRLEPLPLSAIVDLLADTLRSAVGDVGELAELLLEKTEGNPLFVLQFLSSLEDEGLLTYDVGAGGWTWSTQGISSARVTDNVADLVTSKLNRLPSEALETVRLLACLGSSASMDVLGVVAGKQRRRITAVLWQAVDDRLLVRVNDTYLFAHDRIQEAAYNLVQEDERPQIHLRIARLLLARLEPNVLRERIFEVADHMTRGVELLRTSDEREQVAELYLEAGKRAKVSVAYQSALKYFSIGLALIEDERWEDKYALMFDLGLHRAECEYLTGGHAIADQHLVELAARAANPIDVAAVVKLRSSLYVTLGDQGKAVEVALAYMRNFGVHWSPHPTDNEVTVGLQELRDRMGNRSIELLQELPLMTDPAWLAAMDVLACTILPAILTDRNLEDLIYMKIAVFSLEHGNCDASCYAYVSLMIPMGLRFGDYDSGGKYGRLGLALMDLHGLRRFQTRVYSCYACFVVPWTAHLSTSQRYLRKAIETGASSGDLIFSVTSGQTLVSHLLICGAPIATVEKEAYRFLEAARKTGFALAADTATGQLTLIRDLRGSATIDASKPVVPETAVFETYLAGAGERLALPLAWHWIQRIQSSYIAGDYEAAIQAVERAGGLRDARSFIEMAEYHFYGALARAAATDRAPRHARDHQLAQIREHRSHIRAWAESCPENFDSRLLMIDAELARLEGRDLEALRTYDKAIKSASNGGFVQNEAMANERAWRLCVQQGLATGAGTHLKRAHELYLEWGAEGKVRALQAENPDIFGRMAARDRTPEIQYPDVAAVVAMSQAVSGEIVLEQLIERLMVAVIEHSGAVRGTLMLSRDGQMKPVAEATTGQNGITVSQNVDETAALPHTILSYVTHTQEVVILDAAGSADLFREDEYFRRATSMSVLCLPLTRKRQLVGILYLENDLSSHLFTHNQVAVLRVLSSQAAISLENAELYREARQAHEMARTTAEELRLSYDMMPALAWNTRADGTSANFNKRWHDYTAIPPEQAREGAWDRSIHPEDRHAVLDEWHRLLRIGISGEKEARLLRHDGVARSFLLRVAPIRDQSGAIVKWIGTGTDIDDLKRLEEAQHILARAGRLAALGELTASIAHEVNQPLMAIVTNAAACLRWLSEDQLDVAEARETAERIIRDGHRAGDVITSIRALAKKSSLTMEEVDVNETIERVIELTRGELQRCGVALETDLSETTGSTVGDRVQLQQVVLNLILNATEAMKASDEQPRVLTIRSSRIDGKISVSIADSGPGIDRTLMGHVFDAFFTTKPSGLGIGLSICRTILDAHGGQIAVAPNEPTGCVFTFTVGPAPNPSGVPRD